jgi:hypothetical protein
MDQGHEERHMKSKEIRKVTGSIKKKPSTKSTPNSKERKAVIAPLLEFDSPPRLDFDELPDEFIGMDGDDEDHTIGSYILRYQTHFRAVQ